MTAYQPSIASTNWRDGQVSGLPERWKNAMLQQWQDRLEGGKSYIEQGRGPEFLANDGLRRMAEKLHAVRIPLDATDADICGAADTLAEKVNEMRAVLGAPARPGFALPAGHIVGEYSHLDANRKIKGDKPKKNAPAAPVVDVAGACQMAALHAMLERVAQGQGIEPPKVSQCGNFGPAIERMADPIWWRRGLRKMHARSVEGAAISLGYVNRARDCYVSKESLFRRAQQNERAQAMLENTIATNENGEEFTLAELAAKGTSNKAIRRAELMTRIAGFERIAKELGHAGIFMTMTCPSRMHKWATVKHKNGGKPAVFENKKYDGTLPADAQKYMGKVWARIRAKLARDGVKVYGFRIAEPNHDGTPHWHLLLFVEPARLDDLRTIVRAQALKDSPDERGADVHRVDFRLIDPERGSAAGYIAKYVAKNIDGHKLDKDLFGNDAIEASHRVEAWASTWNVRQFQQLGGAPVGVWRELRRVKDMPASAPDYMRDAHDAANRLTDVETGEVKAVAWDRYIKAQGGIFCGRKARIKLCKVRPDGLNRYGEEHAEKAIGVETHTTEYFTPEHMAHMRPAPRIARSIAWIAESTRHVWTIGPAKPSPNLTPNPAPLAPWTCVNNCTGGQEKSPKDSRGEGKTNLERREKWKTKTHRTANCRQ